MASFGKLAIIKSILYSLKLTNKYCMNDADLERSKNIEKQVERWDLYAKLVPTFFLLSSFVFLLLGVSFETMFSVGMLLFGATAVTWWFWTIYSIRHLVKIFRRATENLVNVGEELKTIRTEYQELRDEENNRS